MTDSSHFSWDEALREFLLRCEATRTVKPLRYYKVQFSGLIAWAGRSDIPFDGFGNRHLEFIAATADETLIPETSF